MEKISLFTATRSFDIKGDWSVTRAKLREITGVYYFY